MDEIGIIEKPKCSTDFINFLCRIVGSTLLLFHPASKEKYSKCGLVFALTMIVLVAYQTLYLVYYAIFYSGEQFATSIMIVCWMLQTLFAISFIVYWQFKGHTNVIFNEIKWSEFQPYDRKMGRRIFLLYVGFAFSGLFIVLHMGFNGYCYYKGDMSIINVKLELYHAFGPRFWMLSMTLMSWAMYVWLVVLVCYSMISWVVHLEIESLNTAIKKIGSNNISREAFSEQLLELYDRQMTLTFVIDAMNSTFEVYAFLMIGTNIPTTIFSIMTFAQRLRSAAYSSALFSLPGMLFCFIEIVTLTDAPAKIHSSIRSIEKSVFTNRSIWLPYDQKIYDIARVFISHCTQENLGLSLWGFALMTKSLILTSTSLIFSYLTLLLSMDRTVVITAPMNSTIT